MRTKEKRDPNKIRNERNNNRYHRNRKKIIGEYYEKIHANKVDNQNEMEKFLEAYSLPKLFQQEIDELNR